MKRDILKLIKNDMWETRHNKKYVQAMLKAQLAELEARRKEAIAENDDVADEEVRGWFNRDVNRADRKSVV